MAFRSAEAKECGGHETPTAKLRVSVNSAPARHKIRPLDMFASDNFSHPSQNGQKFPIDAHLAGPEEGAAPVSTLQFSSELYHEAGGASTSPFLGLTVGEDGETTLVIPDGSYYDVASVMSASCETLARSLGWHVERRAVSYTFRDQVV